MEEFIQTCPTCQRVKADHLPPAGLLFPLPVPTRRGGSISLDFLEFPTASSGHDFLQVHTDLTDLPSLAYLHLQDGHSGDGSAQLRFVRVPRRQSA